MGTLNYLPLLGKKQYEIPYFEHAIYFTVKEIQLSSFEVAFHNFSISHLTLRDSRVAEVRLKKNKLFTEIQTGGQVQFPPGTFIRRL